jgi:hypothetical protein
VYVDVKPWWEVRFYLGAQVREGWVARRPDEPSYQPPRPLAGILAGRAGGMLLCAVRHSSVPEFERVVVVAGFRATRVGQDEWTAYYRVSAAADGAGSGS